MLIHAVVDYTFLYYKYKFQLEAGRMRRLTYNIDGEDKDISQIYYSIKEIEKFRKDLEKYGHEVVVSVCFDMPSARKIETEDKTDGENEAASNYKANRVSKLTKEDIDNIGIVKDLLDKAGYNTYREVGHEADDLVSNVLRLYKDEFDYNIIYTPDADLLVNIDNKVGAIRFKTGKGYSQVDKNLFEEYLSAEFKCRVPYNSLMLFKSTVGDKSDGIQGIKGFGPKGFDKLVSYLDENGIKWEEAGSYEYTDALLRGLTGYLGEDKVTQALESLYLVRPMILENLEKPTKRSSKELREQSYSRYEMNSLID